MAKGKHIVRGTLEVPKAKNDKEAVNLGQLKDYVNRYNKEPARVATTSALTGTYLDGVLTLDTPLTKIDEITLSENDTVLVKDQLDATQNGVYLIDATGGILTRRDDFKEGTVILNNTFINVMEGTLNSDTRWTIVSDGSLSVGSSNFNFIKDIDTVQSNIKLSYGSITGDGATTSFSISHNHNLSDPLAYLLLIRDAAGNTISGNDSPTTSKEANSITIEFDTAPEIGENYKVYILGLE